MRAEHHRCSFLVLLALGACQGPVGPAGATGAMGDAGAPGSTGELGTPGPSGEMGAAGCPGLSAGQSPGIVASVTPSAPANGMYFVAGEKASLAISIKDNCGVAYALAGLDHAALYVTGPRGDLAATSACGLLNCTTNLSVVSHHYIDLQSPAYADATQANLSVKADGSLFYQLDAVSTEPAGTYSVLLLLDGPNPIDQVAVTAELQIGTATVGTNAAGPGSSSACASCHQSPMNGHLYMHHSHPSPYSSSTLGDFDIDSLPTETCFACHNANGYSPNTIVEKVHGLHRGADQLDPGVAHPDYDRPADSSLASYTNVVFPAMPNAEMDCTTCHTDDRWKQQPSRMACGTCHDNVFFSTGTLSPPRQFGVACTTDGDCSTLGSYVTCDPTSLTCIRASHAVATDDTTCAGCHPADTGFAPISVAHQIAQRTQDPGLQITNVALSGGSGASGTFNIGDTPVLSFRLVNSTATSVTDLLTNSLYSAALIVAGPTSAPEQLYSSSLNVKTGTVSYDPAADLYSYTFPSPLPASAVAPLNTTAAYSRPNPAGTYTAWLYVDYSQTYDGASFRNAGNALVQFDLGTTAPLQPRQVIAETSCNTCHVKVQGHGGSRQDAEGCFTCHTAGATDLGVGAKGLACTSNAQCPGAAAGWEQCQDTKPPAGLDTCVVIADPTPNAQIDFRVLIHQIHYGRLLGGYAEQSNLVKPGKLSILGYQNSLSDFSQTLLPQDVRSCKTCHSDNAATCSATAPCGYGQTCTSGTCVNTSWLEPSATVCLACHDDQDTYAHTQLNTWTGPSGPVETCNVCHGQGAQFAVDVVHNITDPYVPPYPRE